MTACVHFLKENNKNTKKTAKKNKPVNVRKTGPNHRFKAERGENKSKSNRARREKKRKRKKNRSYNQKAKKAQKSSKKLKKAQKAQKNSKKNSKKKHVRWRGQASGSQAESGACAQGAR
jgi:hypothetical protein